MTNALRCGGVGSPAAAAAAAPAADVRAVALVVQRLEQAYAPATDEPPASVMTTPLPPSASGPAWSTTHPA